ncbi:MAG: hypothetical protein U5K32_13345 [Bacteroidales bacterium]|nr:hypothetical protein [Bacteroidales bacterium]
MGRPGVWIIKCFAWKNGQLLIKNKGELVSPVVIAGMKGDSVYFEKWVDGFEGQEMD